MGSVGRGVEGGGGRFPPLVSPTGRAVAERGSLVERAFGRVAEFVLHRGHRDITRVTLAGADRDVRRCLCIAGAEHCTLLYHASDLPSRSLSLARALLLLLRSESLSFLLAFFANSRANLRVIARANLIALVIILLISLSEIERLGRVELSILFLRGKICVFIFAYEIARHNLFIYERDITRL